MNHFNYPRIWPEESGKRNTIHDEKGDKVMIDDLYEKNQRAMLPTSENVKFPEFSINPDLRDQFAMAALTSIDSWRAIFQSSYHTQSIPRIAKISYKIADAMMKERALENEPDEQPIEGIFDELDLSNKSDKKLLIEKCLLITEEDTRIYISKK